MHISIYVCSVFFCIFKYICIYYIRNSLVYATACIFVKISFFIYFFCLKICLFTCIFPFIQTICLSICLDSCYLCTIFILIEIFIHKLNTNRIFCIILLSYMQHANIIETICYKNMNFN